MMIGQGLASQSTFGSAQLYPRILDQLVPTPGEIFPKKFFQKMCVKTLVTGAKFHAKIPSRSGVIKKNPPVGGSTPPSLRSREPDMILT